MQNRVDMLEGKSPSPVPQMQPQHLPQMPDAEMAAENDPAEISIFGSIRFDGNGNFATKILPETENPQEFYKIGYQHILAGDYPAAEQIFRAFQERFPDDEQQADASFWLGEALYGQGKYREAAQVYIDVQRHHENSLHGPENLLKLGLSMAQLQETEVACKTLTEVPKRYEKVEPAVLKRVNDEKRRLGCS